MSEFIDCVLNKKLWVYSNDEGQWRCFTSAQSAIESAPPLTQIDTIEAKQIDGRQVWMIQNADGTSEILRPNPPPPTAPASNGAPTFTTQGGNLTVNYTISGGTIAHLVYGMSANNAPFGQANPSTEIGDVPESE